MFDQPLVLAIIKQIAEALDKISYRTEKTLSVADFTNSSDGMEKLDSVCMLFVAIGESLKNIDKITDGTLLARYPEIDWKGIKGFRDIISHNYFDVDADQVFWVCKNNLIPLAEIIKKIIKDLSS